MGKVNLYVPDDLLLEMRKYQINWSKLFRETIETYIRKHHNAQFKARHYNRHMPRKVR